MPTPASIWQAIGSPKARASLAVAVCFWVLASGVVTLREQIVRLRPGQYAHQDVLSRVRFESRDVELEHKLQQAAREATPRVYDRIDNAFAQLERRLLSLREQAASRSPNPAPRGWHLDATAMAALRSTDPAVHKQQIARYLALLSQLRDKGDLIVFRQEDREQDLQFPDRIEAKVQGAAANAYASVKVDDTFWRKDSAPPAEPQRQELLKLITPAAEASFGQLLADAIAQFTADTLEPTHELNAELTAADQEAAARAVSLAPARRHILEKAVLVRRGNLVTVPVWKLLAEEQRAYVAQMPMPQWILMHAGMSLVVALVTIAMAGYSAVYQPRIIRRPARAMALAGMLLAMLVIAQLAGIGSGPLLIFGVAPAILTAMIVCIAYDQRFAMAMGSLTALLVTISLDQETSFFLIMWLGVMTCCFLLDDVRSRSKPLEVGAASALAMIVAAAALGALWSDPVGAIGQSCLHVGAAGLGSGFIILGILPFIERTFRITTSMTLLEVADVSQPLLRRLAVEAPGTYNHSIQVATLAEAAAEAIGANALLCRVGSYYHDIGKMKKSDYFCENQFDGQNRHINLNPNVSLLIILGHVKDGVELAREYNLPPVLLPMIEQHHGTLLVEYFYHQACTQRAAEAADSPAISDQQFRYPGPRPQTREAAIVMIADAVESATRAMVDPTGARIETLVHELVTKRLFDGQFDEADMTFVELQQIERSLVKMLLGIYHGRLAYPSTAAVTHGKPGPAAKTA